ncbi:MAG: 50S ribosomal protein L10 [Alphaproteobacteria bacterium]|nr:50S ribosomal protein L10 [Alphaproteobacteria bacterium]HCQ71667.1 50S ribosomal protein L10 [Rhodospirillaceae bacterium]
MSRAQKQAEIQELNERFERDETIIITHYSGLSVAEITDLRAQLRAEGASLKVTKNTLAKIALKGTKFEETTDLFSGPTAVASSQDPVAAAKAVHKYAKDNDKLIIIGGAMGSQVLDVDGVKALAAMPSLDELRGKLVGLLVAPATKIARVLQAPAQQMVGVTKAYGEKS